MNRTKLLAVTHSGVFHADEVMASVILREIYDEVKIIRSRDPRDFASADIVYDVGDGEFDHHSDNKEYRETGIPYSACGLVWRAYGHEVVKKRGPNLTSDQVDEVFYSIDEGIIESIDATDNGFPMVQSEIHMPTVDQMVKGFNPNWNSQEDPEEQFKKAIDFCTPILCNAVDGSIAAIEAETMVKQSFEDREVENILILDRFCPWKRHLRRYDEEGHIIYVIFKDLVNGYRIQAVSEADSRESIKPFPREWAGKDADEINALVDIDDAIFVHPGRFIAGAGSLNSAVKMAELALIY